MRIVIDMQGAQTESRFRGIGRYTLSFAQAVARNRGQHEVFLALSGLFPDTIEPIRGAFDGLIPQSNIRVWHAPGNVKASDPDNLARRNTAEIVREAFLASLQPDVVHVASLFEGYLDDAVTSIGRFDQRTLVSASLYDLIPMLNPEQYLNTDQGYADYYDRKISSLRKASGLLAISQHTREEGETCLGTAANHIVNVSTAISSNFQIKKVDEADSQQLRQKFKITKPFVLYTGGSDERKNLPRLIEAWAALPADVLTNHQLLMAGKMNSGDVVRLQEMAHRQGLKPDDLLLSGYITDDELVLLYNSCKLYVFPSWHEGFGLPALEAMACGAAVIAANTTSLPEVVGLNDALFDPRSTPAISAKLLQALTDEAFLQRLRLHSSTRAQLFSWDNTARRALAAWEQMADKAVQIKSQQNDLCNANLVSALTPFLTRLNDADLKELACCLAKNEVAGVQRQIFLDVSRFCAEKTEVASKLQQEEKDCLTKILTEPCDAYRVELVYARESNEYRYARQLTQRLLGLPDLDAKDPPIRWQRGDHFFAQALPTEMPLTLTAFHEQLQREGVFIHCWKDEAPVASSTWLRRFLHAEGQTETWQNQTKPKQLLVDISELVKHDARSGIQRVVRSILHQWLTEPPTGYQVEPVYASATESYRYAQRYIAGFLGRVAVEQPDDFVEVGPGDVFVSLDLLHQVATAQKEHLQAWRATGVSVWSVVYDLLPLQLPDCFVPEVHDYHQTWLETISEFDGALCISKAVADDLQQWLRQHPPLRHRPFAVKWFHLGADLDASAPTRGWPADGARTLEAIKSRPSFLMVSTIEPRKGHDQVVEAFEQLWGTAFDANLVIVGKQGWRVDALVEKMRQHPEAGHRLLWLEGVSDEFLEQIYAACTCLIVASKGEGFGLPLIEAAQHKLPIIARELPVLREVAGEHALYFVGERASDLANVIRHWLELYKQGTHPCSEGLHWLTWKESAASLAQLVLSETDINTAIGVTQK